LSNNDGDPHIDRRRDNDDVNCANDSTADANTVNNVYIHNRQSAASVGIARHDDCRLSVDGGNSCECGEKRLSVDFVDAACGYTSHFCNTVRQFQYVAVANARAY
jgi:hypothetical protein